MNVTFKLKDPLPHITEHFALGGTRAGTEGSGDVSNIRDYCCFWDGEGKLAKSSKVGKKRWESATQILELFLYKLIGTL